MTIARLSLDRLRAAPWNPNTMDDELLAKLRRSVERHGVVENLVVRPLGGGNYEVLSGNQRLSVYRSLELRRVPCVIVELNDGRARLLAQTLNRTRGSDDLGAKVVLLRDVLADIPQAEVLALLPETAASLRYLSTLGADTLADRLRTFEQARASAGLTQMTFALTASEVPAVERALRLVASEAQCSPELRGRGRALAALSRAYLSCRKKGVE